MISEESVGLYRRRKMKKETDKLNQKLTEALRKRGLIHAAPKGRTLKKSFAKQTAARIRRLQLVNLRSAEEIQKGIRLTDDCSIFYD